MQRDSMTGMDLTADPRQKDPSPGAKVVRLARRRRQGSDRLDLAEHEEPSNAGELRVNRVVGPEDSTLSAAIRIWRVLDVRVKYEVRGPAGSAASLCVAVMVLSVVAAVIVPTLILPDATSVGVRLIVALASGGAVLITGVLAIYWLRKRR